jgi:glycosyltransferase involved in cell wall biosynthesis
MNVLINGVSAKSGGAKTYIENLIAQLARADKGHKYIFYVPSSLRDTVTAQWGNNISVVATDIASSSPWKRFLWDQFTLRTIVRKMKISVLVSSSDFGMTFPPCRQILLIRNSLFFSSLYNKTCSVRQSWRSRLNLMIRRRIVLLSVMFSDVAVAASQSILEEMKRFIDLTNKKTVVNPFGVPLHNFGVAKHNRQRELEEQGREHFRLLHVSEYCDYKNLTVLLKAIRILSEQGFTLFNLVTTADPWQHPADELVTRKEDQLLAHHPMVAPFVKFTGAVPYTEVPKLYASSDLFVFPSIAESFGHPLVEAMASGLPVLASDIPVCREICGQAALYFSPFDEKELADAILRLWDDTALRRELGQVGRRRAETYFDWSDHVRRLLNLIEEVSSNA